MSGSARICSRCGTWEAIPSPFTTTCARCNPVLVGPDLGLKPSNSPPYHGGLWMVAAGNAALDGVRRDTVVALLIGDTWVPIRRGSLRQPLERLEAFEAEPDGFKSVLRGAVAAVQAIRTVAATDADRIAEALHDLDIAAEVVRNPEGAIIGIQIKGILNFDAHGERIR